MVRPMWFIKSLISSFPQRFFFARFSHIPIIGRIIEYMAFEDDHIYYLLKDDVAQSDNTSIDSGLKTKTLEVNKPITRTPDTVLPSHVVEHFIEESNYHWVMNFCICRLSSDCQDYPSHLGCLFLGEASIGIDPRLGRQVTKEEAKEHINKCREAGLVHLVGRNKLDTVWLDLSPGNKLMTICNCCNCCCLWKMIPNLAPQIESKVMKMPGIQVTVSTDDCIGCDICIETCFVKAIKLIDEKAVISDSCRGCGRCASECPNEAIKVSISNPDYVQTTINNMTRLVTVK
ncbi:MAG: indolepyruvate ferredoxin oxidoreductase subunit alpha [Candidatus Hodarchaeales archaeon]|jgi:ferredoxin